MKHTIVYLATLLACTCMTGCSKSGAEPVTANMEKSAGATGSPQKPVSNKVLAVVDGANVTDDDLRPLLEAGIDKAIAMDRYINKVIAAQVAEKKFKTEADKAMKSVERDVLSQLYLQKTSQRIEAQISESEVKAYYEKNVKIEDFQQYEVTYYLTQDKSDADTVSEEASQGKREVVSRFKPIREGAERHVFLKEMPYGLGQVVRPLKAGSVSKPVALRNGFFVLHVLDIKEGKKPALATVSAEIKNILLTERLAKELEEHRSIAKIELK